MSEETTTITRERAITLINDSIENFATYFDSYCCDNPDSITDEDKELYEEMSQVTNILRNDADYANDLKIMPLEHLKQFLYMCKEMVENNDLFTKNSYPKGNILIVENENSNPELIEKALESLERYGDVKIKNSIKEYNNGERKIVFRNMPKNQYGITERTNETYINYLSEDLNHDSPENLVRVAVTLAHEFRRNATSDSVDGETRNIILDDTKIIESFAASYGEEIYKKFPEYGILHYIKKIFGETELQDFADYAFDSTGSYWKVNDAGDLIDDGNTTKVFDKDGNEQELRYESKNNGRQGTLEKWLGVENANIALMEVAGYVWQENTDETGKWIVNPGKIEASKIKEAYDKGLITDDQYNLIQLAAGKASSKEEGAEKVSLFQQVLIDYQKYNEIDTQIKVDMVNRAWEWIELLLNKLFCKSSKTENNTENNTDKYNQLNERYKKVKNVQYSNDTSKIDHDSNYKTLDTTKYLNCICFVCYMYNITASYSVSNFDKYTQFSQLKDIKNVNQLQIGDVITWEYESGEVDKNSKPIYEYHASIWKGNDEIWECMDPNGVRTRQYSSYYKWMNEHNHKINKVKYFRFKES